MKHAFYIPNYDILVDSPIEIGNHEVISFEAAGVPHEVVMYGATDYNPEQIKRDLTKIVESATAIFGENPNEKYIFFLHHGERDAGGLEHMNSTVLGLSRWAYQYKNSYDHFLALAAHEYFHLWMVKRLKPVELEHLDYDRENYTDMLWLMEGITSYYDQKIMLRAGFYDETEFLNNLLDEMSDVKNTPGSRVQSLTEASFDAWIKYYRRDENSNNSQISYYTKGTIIGALLDLKIISSSGGKYSLDDVVYQLYHQFYKKEEKGLTGDDFKKAAEQAVGSSLDQFFDDYVYGTTDLDNEKYLKLAGIELIDLNQTINDKSIGIWYSASACGLEVSQVIRNSSAFDNGLNVGDELIAVDDYRINEENFDQLISRYKVGDRATFTISRNGIVRSISLEIRKNTSVDYSFEMTKNPGKQQEKTYKVWMGK